MDFIRLNRHVMKGTSTFGDMFFGDKNLEGFADGGFVGKRQNAINRRARLLERREISRERLRSKRVSDIAAFKDETAKRFPGFPALTDEEAVRGLLGSRRGGRGKVGAEARPIFAKNLEEAKLGYDLS